MPKRTSDEKIIYYQKKLLKLEKERQIRLQLDSNDSGNNPVPAENNPIEASHAELPQEIDEDLLNETLPSASANQAESQNYTSLNELADDETNTEELVLDPSLLEALGEATDALPEFGPKIVDTLSKLWLPLLKTGMLKASKDKLLEEYLVPENCQLLQAPKLNIEISTAITDISRNRDKKLQLLQQQLGQGITAINRGLDELLKGDNKSLAIKHLSNSCRILCDLHTTWSQYRTKLVTPGLDKLFTSIISDLERDQYLFGSTLAEKIKAAKTIERQGLQIKKNVPNTTRSTASQSTSSRSNQGNWTGPPRPLSNRGGRGTFRKPAVPNRRPYHPLPTTSAPSLTYNRGQNNRPRAPQ